MKTVSSMKMKANGGNKAEKREMKSMARKLRKRKRYGY
jgi:hypothetical protein